MKLQNFGLLAILTIVSACGGSTFSEIIESKPLQLTAEVDRQIKSSITNDFLDPDSAQFRNIRAVEVSLANGSKERRVCGEVNGKNSAGGYTGYDLFGGTLIDGRFVPQPFFAPCEAW